MDKKIIYEVAETGHWKELHPKKNMMLGSHNLNPDEEIVLRITQVEKGVIIKGENGREDEITCLHFDKTVPMALNITNSQVLASLYGEKWYGWIDRYVQVYVDPDCKQVGGGRGPGLRIRHQIPDMGEDASEYETLILNCANMGELKMVWEKKIPKHLWKRLNSVKDQRKAELA